jgi:hypothetical protein
MSIRSAAVFAFLSAVLAPTLAHAREQDRDYCSDRPGIGTPACTMAPGRVSIEVGLGDWSLDRDATTREDRFQAADLLLRYGVADHAEVQIGWTSLGFTRTRDRATGAVEHASGTGDVTLALRRNLVSPDGSGLSVAVMPSVTLPVGRQPAGAGDWGAGVLVPLSYELSDTWSLVTTTEIDAAVDEDGHGRHLAFGEVVGASAKLGETVTATAEYQILADRDPQGHGTSHLSGLSFGWQPTDNFQIDAGTNVGLNHNAPDVEVYFGVSRRF